MKISPLTMIVAGVLLAQVSGAFGQTMGPGAPQPGLPGGRPPDAIDHARGLATQPFNTLPLPPQQPAQRYIPEKRMYSPELGRDVQVPGHFAQPTPDCRVIEPPMIVPGPQGRAPLYMPGGERPSQ
jgi:hypothetical protein